MSDILHLAIYTTDDGRITSVVERDEDGDPCDREIDASAIINHVARLVGERDQARANQTVEELRVLRQRVEKIIPLNADNWSPPNKENCEDCSVACYHECKKCWQEYFFGDSNVQDSGVKK